jgi:ABC-type multidrug transport system fused ATPase/permease subunit
VCFFGAIVGTNLNASRFLEENAIQGLFQSPLSFFESQPIGRILNRLTADVQSMDIEFMSVLLNLPSSIGELIVNIVLVSQASPYILSTFLLT